MNGTLLEYGWNINEKMSLSYHYGKWPSTRGMIRGKMETLSCINGIRKIIEYEWDIGIVMDMFQKNAYNL